MAKAVSQIEVNAPAGQVYRAFTNASDLRRWLCDVATVDPRPRGRMYLWWIGDFYSSGFYLELVPEESIKFRWHSNIDPAGTDVLVSLESSNDMTNVVMTHTAPDSPEWQNLLAGFKSNWDLSLKNLKSVLESGSDLRIANQPMLGILPGDFTTEQARHLGVPVSEGLRLDGVVNGMGAAAAGLQKDDVIIEFDGKKIGVTAGDFRNAIAGKKGGETIEVIFYRGSEKKSVTMSLTRRPMVDVPFAPTELARQGRIKLEAALAEVEKCFEGVSETEANARSEIGEWSALETVAHLLHTERSNQFYIVELVDGFVRTADGFGSNNEAQIKATISIYPTARSLLQALHNSIEETLALVNNLPEPFSQDKSSFYQVGTLILQGDFHYYAHISQIKTSIAAVRIK